MLQKLKAHIIPVIVLLVLSLVPFLWLKNDAVILGHDAGTPLSPSAHFTDRLSVWTYRYAGGSDQTFALGGFFVHGFEYALDQLPLSVSDQQKIEFSIYFLLMGLSMYVSAQLIFRKLEPQFALIAAVIYEFNHFILQAWFIAERTKFSVYIALPILAALLIMVFRKQLKPLTAGVLSGLIMTVFNGGGFLPLYASVFLTLGVSIICYLFFFTDNFLNRLKDTAIYCISVVTVYVLCNMFWMLPYYWYVKTSFSQLVGEAGGMAGILNWVTAISQNTSFLNLFRLQGIQEWYVNPEHPYAGKYFSNPLLILFSYVPIVVIAAAFLQLKKQRNRIIAILLLVLLLAIFLMAGSHKPFGFIYVFLLKYVPGFIAFRTPYYKFAPAFFFAFALIASYVSAKYLTTVKRRSIAVTAIVIIYLFYNFPFFTSNIFQYTSERTTKVEVPSYVYEYADYIEQNPDNLTRTALFPGMSFRDYTSQYNWGYWSLAPLHSLLDNHQYLIPQRATNTESELVAELYRAIALNQSEWITIAQTLGVDSILVENDFNEFNYLDASSEEIQENFKANPELTLIKEFGEWQLYKINTPKLVHSNYLQVYAPSTRIGEINHISNLVFTYLNFKTPLMYSATKIESQNRVGTLVKADCHDCQLRRELTFLADPNIIFVPGSKLGYLARLLGLDHQYNNPTLDSLQKLYILQALVQRKEPGSLRVPTWHEYIKNLHDYEEVIDRELGNENLNHTSIVNHYSNISFQKNGIKDLAQFINGAVEADLYLEALEKMRQIEQKILATRKITTARNNYKLTVVPPEPGDYDVYAYNRLLNASTNRNTLKFSMNNVETTAQLTPDKQWTLLTTQSLQNQEYTIEIKDDTFKNPTDVKPSVTLGADQTCEPILEHELREGLYLIDISVLSETTNANLTLHILKEGQPQPLLPYWGNAIEVLQNLGRSSIVDFDLPEDTKTTFLLCAFSLKVPAEFKVQKFELSRQANPLIYLYKKDQDQRPASGSYEITRDSNTQTTYTISTNAPGMINSLRPYNPNWQITGYSPDAFVRINEGMSNIIVPEGEYKITEKYTNEKYHTFGIQVSLLAAMLSISYLLYQLWLPKKK
jgi:hypothetical protein